MNASNLNLREYFTVCNKLGRSVHQMQHNKQKVNVATHRVPIKEHVLAVFCPPAQQQPPFTC